MKTVLLELIKPFGFKATQLNEVVQLLDSDSGRYILSSSHRVLKDRKHLIISPLKDFHKATVVVEEPGTIDFTGGVLHFMQTQKRRPELVSMWPCLMPH
ncbi:hypothetical protein LWM68_29405 [Niabella sp. W65]|nr:hypothetical protein [Niabella sp. W65]MCH7366525.1 hypothetical protein [Niabella sp. W65]ULT42235.1 hypothetical protein KRR40_00845 [Niabella sp. I65]